MKVKRTHQGLPTAKSQPRNPRRPKSRRARRTWTCRAQIHTYHSSRPPHRNRCPSGLEAGRKRRATGRLIPTATHSRIFRTPSAEWQHLPTLHARYRDHHHQHHYRLQRRQQIPPSHPISSTPDPSPSASPPSYPSASGCGNGCRNMSTEDGGSNNNNNNNNRVSDRARVRAMIGRGGG